MVCNKDCFNCPYPDCINDEVDALDVHYADVRDKQLVDKPQKTDYYTKYNHSEKRKIVAKRYNQSEKGKANSLKGSKTFYQKHREEKLLYWKLYYAKNKDAILEKAKKRRRQKKQEVC